MELTIHNVVLRGTKTNKSQPLLFCKEGGEKYNSSTYTAMVQSGAPAKTIKRDTDRHKLFTFFLFSSLSTEGFTFLFS